MESEGGELVGEEGEGAEQCAFERLVNVGGDEGEGEEGRGGGGEEGVDYGGVTGRTAELELA